MRIADSARQKRVDRGFSGPLKASIPSAGRRTRHQNDKKPTLPVAMNDRSRTPKRPGHVDFGPIPASGISASPRARMKLKFPCPMPPQSFSFSNPRILTRTSVT